MLKYYKNKKYQTYKIVKLIKKFLRNNQPDKKEKISGYVDYYIERTYNIGKYKLLHQRLTRGDLIKLQANNRSIITYVDQSYQYSGLLGINDLKACIGWKNLKKLLTF
jgi:hypothetical protein